MKNIIKQLQIMSLAFLFAACNQIACSQKPADKPADRTETELLDRIDEGTAQEALKIITENPQIIYCTDHHDETPLTLAAWEGNQEKVQYLIDSKSNMEHKNDNGATALFLATDRCHHEIVIQLIRAKADVETTNKYDITLLERVSKCSGHDALRTLDALFLAESANGKPKRAACCGYGKALLALMNK